MVPDVGDEEAAAGASCESVCMECVGCDSKEVGGGGGGCRWDDSPETRNNHGMGAWVMMIAVFPGSALLSWQRVGVGAAHGCPWDFWSWMAIGYAALMLSLGVWLACDRKRVQVFTAVRHATTALAVVATGYLGGVMGSLITGPALCGKDFGVGLLVFIGLLGAITLIVLVGCCFVERWRGAAAAVQLRHTAQPILAAHSTAPAPHVPAGPAPAAARQTQGSEMATAVVVR